MLWPSTRRPRRLDAEVEKRLALVRQNNHASETWLALIEAGLQEAADVARWHVVVPTVRADRAARTPLLQGAEMTVDRRASRRFVEHLADLAALEGPDRQRLDPIALLEAAICQDDSRIDSPALRVVAQVATLPLLVTAAQQLGREAIPATWWEGYCPVCAAWPALAEFRGLERKRWLRCGRCGTAWEIPWLRCPYCGETHHEQLGYLAPEEGETSRKVEVCHTCNGYLKSEPTVSTLPWWGVLLDDAATVALDVAALDRGYHRPERPGFALTARVVAR